MFWNDLERALCYFKIKGRLIHKKKRYESEGAFLKACYDFYPYETYFDWFHRNKLNWIFEYDASKKAKAKFYKTTVIFCPLNEVDQLIEELKLDGLDMNNNTEMNTKEEFWHRNFHKHLKHLE